MIIGLSKEGVSMKLCLGTVQQGMEYGVNNHYGKPSLEDSIAVFHEAFERGIDVFDTARAYGDAELIIGEYVKRYEEAKEIKYISKLRPNVFEVGDNYYEVIKRECLDSLARMGISKLYGYLLHTPEYIRNPEIVEAMVRIKEEGLVENIGVSIYNIEDGEIAIQTNKVDFIQLPFSVFDQRGDTTGFLKRAKENGITIFARSAFLQGLFYANVDRLPERVEHTKNVLVNFNQLIEKYRVDRTETLIGFVKAQAYIDYLVFGVDNLEQLEEDIDVFNNKKIDSKMLSDIKEKYARIEESIIIPSLWSNGKKAK